MTEFRLAKKYVDILLVIRACGDQPPTIREIASFLKVPWKTVDERMKRLMIEGYLTRRFNSSRTTALTEKAAGAVGHLVAVAMDGTVLRPVCREDVTRGR